MKIKVNGEELELQDGAVLADVCTKLGIEGKGVAFAINCDVIPRDEWISTKLEDGAEVMMIRAACGG